MFKTILGTILVALPSLAQTFEVASIKPAQPPTPDGQGRIFMRGPSGGPGTKDPGRVNLPFMSLKSLIMLAYDVKNYQITGPQWLDTERFDVTATMPPDTTKEQYRIMLQNLLIERFKMTVHKESKELPMYSLIVNKGGPKLKETALKATPADGDGPPRPPLGPPKIGPDGFPVMPAEMSQRPGMPMMMMPGRARLMATSQSMQDLANRLTAQLNRPVIDNTGLTAKYDFVLTYAPDPNEGLGGRGGAGLGLAVRAPAPAGAAGGPDNTFIPDGEAPQPLFGALQSQLGLKLDPKKGDVEIVVIDKMEKAPVEN
jgi:uncharacterized protein (TIGR03435 family)